MNFAILVLKKERKKIVPKYLSDDNDMFASTNFSFKGDLAGGNGSDQWAIDKSNKSRPAWYNKPATKDRLIFYTQFIPSNYFLIRFDIACDIREVYLNRWIDYGYNPKTPENCGLSQLEMLKHVTRELLGVTT